MYTPSPIMNNNNNAKEQSSSRSLPNQQKHQFPVRAPNQKLKEDTSKTYFVKCVSSYPLVFETSKEELRINYVHGRSQGKPMGFNQQIQQMTTPMMMMPLSQHQGNIPPKLGMPNQIMMASNSSSSAGGQVIATGSNPFMKNVQQFPQQQKQMNPLIPQQLQQQMMMNNNRNNPMFNQKQQQFNNINNITKPQLQNIQGNNNRNPFIPSSQNNNNNNQYNKTIQNNQSRNNNMFGTINTTTTPATTTGLLSPGLVRQTSFGAVTETTQQAPTFGGGITWNINNQPQQPTTGGLFNNPTTVPQQLANTPSFSNLPKQTITGGQQIGQNSNLPFAQTTTTPTQGVFGAQLGNQPQTTFPTTLPLQQQSVQPLPTSSTLDTNIKQLLESKPNLWNILALDPDFKNGFNQHGRIYVKSVLQRIIDQNIISGQSLNKIIIEIYKQIYGQDNFQKMLQNKKTQLKSFDLLNNTNLDYNMVKQIKDDNVRSVFPEDVNALGDEFYRSFKRIPAKSRQSKLIDNSDRFRFQRKFYQVKKPLQVKFKFIQIKKPIDSTKKSLYNQQSLEKIAQNITDIRKQQRKQIMPTQQELPNIQGFTIVPSFNTIKTYTKHQLLSVPKVTISNQWGCIRFKSPICLLGKTLKDCIIINQKSVQIIDQQWKVRQAQITFRKFADFNSLQEDEQNELQEKIINWCEKEKFELVKVDRARGVVVIQV